jgi:beta-N-acetylhexosaminidase
MTINYLTIEEKIGQMLCFSFHGQTCNQQLQTLIQDYKLGSVIHFAHNIANVDQVKKLNEDLQAMSKIPLFIGLDQEGGMVRRIVSDITYLPGAMSLCASNVDKIYDVNYQTGLDLKALGFNVNYAPVGDVNNNPDNPVINSRSYSDNPNVVSDCVNRAFQGLQDALILPTVKHFPGHGDTNVDSHLGLPVVTKTNEEIKNLELIPFQKAISAGVDGIMISHILYSQLDEEFPSSLSYNVIRRLLIEKMGFKGLITTDSLTMAAIWGKYSIEEIVQHGVNAGNDILVFCGKADLKEQIEIVQTFKRLVQENKISIERIDESVNKILKLKAKYCSKPLVKKTQIDNTLSFDLVSKSITKVMDNNLLPIQASDKVLIVFPKIYLASLVDNENNTYETLGKHLKYEEIIIDNDFNDFDKILHIQNEYDKIIMATYNVRDNDYQQKVFDLMDKEKTIVISLRSPFDIHKLKGVKSYICCYDFTKETLQSVSQKLANNEFYGKMPVKL